MKPFLAGLLKCSKCGSCEIPFIFPSKIVETYYDGNRPSVADFVEKKDFLLNLVSSISELKDVNFELSEADVYTFCDTNGSEGVENIGRLLFSYDVVEGTMICSNDDCKVEHTIKDGILRY